MSKSNFARREAERKAKSLLGHYFRVVFENVGLHWRSDNQAEIDEMVDTLLAVIYDEIDSVRAPVVADSALAELRRLYK